MKAVGIATFVIALVAPVSAAAQVNLTATTGSLQAYQEYLEGLRHLYRWELKEAAARFRTAISHDSTFALAYHRLALAIMSQPGLPDEIGESAASAVRYSERLPWRERQHVLAYNAYVHDDVDLARQMYRELITADSSDAEAWFHLGNVEVFDRVLALGPDGDLHPRSNLNVALQAFHRAVELDPNFHLGYGHLFDIYQRVDRRALFRRPGESAYSVYFHSAWRDSFVWVRWPEPSTPPRTRPLSTDSVVTMFQDRAFTLARRWSNAAPDEVRPHEVLRDLYVERRDYKGALSEQRTVFGLTHHYRDQLNLGTLYLANGVYDSAVALTEGGLAALRDREADPLEIRTGDVSRARGMAANVFIALGQPSRALEVSGEPGTGPRWLLPYAIDFRADENSVRRTLSILGSCGADRPELRAALDSLLRIWSEPRYKPEEVKWLLENFTPEPALFLLGENAVRDWFARLDSVPSSWRSYLQLQADSVTAAARSLDQAVAQLNGRPSYLLANVAQALGRDSLALDLFARMDTSNHWMAGWGLLSLSYLQRARSYEALGDTARAEEYYERFVTVWRDAEPDLQHYADEARGALERLGRRPRHQR